MFYPNEIINQLEQNASAFKYLLSGISSEECGFKAAPDKWCLLELICHLYDEEREDFRARTLSILDDPTKLFDPIDPVGWVSKRNYTDQNFNEKLDSFLMERKISVDKLRSYRAPNWSNTYQHPSLGPISAAQMLSNWLAHDYIHLRQIVKIKYARLQSNLSDQDLGYAGNW